MAQAHAHILGMTSIPDRIVSVFDREARPIRRGKLNVQTEFGYKALFTETEDRVITHYEVHGRSPDDSGLLAAALKGHTQTVLRIPQVVVADRGFGQQGQ
jgi:hypothetical protein